MKSIVHKPHIQSWRYRNELVTNLNGVILKDLILIVNEYGNNGEYHNNLMETVLSRFLQESMTDITNNVIFTVPGYSDIVSIYTEALDKFSHALE
jgi:hypothetical protein